MRAETVRALLLSWIGLLAAGCGDDTTSLTIEVTSPMAVPAEIDSLDFLVVGETSGAMLDRSFPLETGWPHSITVMPAGDPTEMLTITVSGRRSGAVSGEFVVQQRVMEPFVEGEERLVQIVLPRDCMFITCGEFHNCVDGVCVGLMLDGGMPDGGDAMVDAGPACVTSADCDDGVACTVDACTAGTCSSTPDDSMCADGESCNPLSGCSVDCAGGDPLVCDDMDDCTSGICDESAMMCVFTTRDADMDGHGTTVCPELGGVPPDDCDDTDPAIFLGAVETCNGRDDNCDGACDDGFSCCAGATGSCATSCGSMGTRTCSSACAWSVCATPPEICNGLDDDCNTACDDGFDCCQGAVSPCTTTCGSTGTQTCDGGCNLGSCVPPFELCNTVDDDCDGAVDESSCGACMDTPDCDDGNPCNGAETCERGACTPGTALVCNDGVPCTVDSCNPSTGCVATPDDRFCTDGNFCNGAETCTATGCQPGTPPLCDDGDACTENACIGAAPGMCVATTLDADDDGYGALACAAVGGVPNTDCDDTRSAVSPGATETCNARDDDCDGTTDETFSCVRGTTTGCTTGCGTMGTRTCSTTCTLGSCVPPAESCNAMDDDCDGTIDETVECTAGSMGSCTTSCGSTGTRTCSAACTWETCNAPAETCNGLDDDCDGTIDETFTCVPGTVGSCGSSCGTSGTRTCSATCTWGTCTPPTEVCNGVDDDCDTTCDEGSTCCAGSSGTCTTGCGSTGTRTCSSSCGWGSCNPPAETCNGADDDCDGMCDDGFACCAGSAGSCTTSCGSTGTRSCSSGCAWGTCNIPAETCNGIDDDCDGTCDEGSTCCAGTMETCATSCGSTGTRTCSASCGWGSCSPPVETCNGVDDDCDGMVDEGCGACAGCTGAVGVSSPGGRYAVSLGAHAHTGSCGGAGSEGYLTFTTTSTADVFISTLGSGIDTVVYVRSCTCNGSEVGCNDNSLGHTGSAVHLRDLAAGTYNVIVDTKVAMSAMISVDVSIGAPGASGDRCSDPLPLSAGTASFSGNSCGSVNDYDNQLTADCDTTGTGNAEEEVYYFYVPTTRSVTFDGCTTGSSYDSTFYIRRACNDSSLANQAICNDDGCGGSRWSCTGGRRSSATVTLTPGLYYLLVDGWSTPPDDCACGSYDVNVTGL